VQGVRDAFSGAKKGNGMMTRPPWGAATLVALAGGQAYANGDDHQPAATGYIGAAYIHSDIDFDDDDDFFFDDDDGDDGWGIEGAVAVMATPDVGAQLAGVIGDFGGDDTIVSLNGHLNLRNEERLIGGFVSVGEIADDNSFWAIGGEGELYWPNVTLAGALAYGNFENGDGDAWSIDGEARYFFTENFRLEGELGFANFDAVFGDEDVFSVGVGGEFQFDASPISLFASYAHEEFDSSDLSADIITIGARLNFGTTLRMRDLIGASLPGLSRFAPALGD
jgi:hypothetical protein